MAQIESMTYIEHRTLNTVPVNEKLKLCKKMRKGENNNKNNKKNSVSLTGKSNAQGNNEFDSLRSNKNPSTLRYLTGMTMASMFTLAYIIGPISLPLTIISLLFYPTSTRVWLWCSPVILSMLYSPPQMPWLLENMTPILDYFQYEEAMEMSNEEFLDLGKKNKSFIFAAVPHGVFSYGAVCRAIAEPYEFKRTKTAVAPAVAFIPFIKNVVGIFGFVGASATSLKKHFKRGGLKGCVVLYVGGMAELFKCSLDEERLYLSKRKGFIKLALREGVDVVPLYFFGNTSVLSILKAAPLEWMSRKLQTSVTFFWGKFGTFIPRDDKIFVVLGRPLGMPKIENPTNEDVDKWHMKYCDEVKRIFNKYKEKVPQYKDKELFID